jgi:hypothetical protein
MAQARAEQDPAVIAFRLQRMRNAPRNWCWWVAAFTAVNGVVGLTQSDVLILAGLVIPFAVQGTWAHFAGAAVLGVVGYLGQQHRSLFVVALIAYILDAALAALLGFWSGVVMHIVVLALVGIALNGARLLVKQQLHLPQAVAADPSKTNTD